MSAAERLLERMQRSKAGWGQDDFDRLYRGFGFDVREGGNHRIYSHPDHADLRATVGRHDELAPAYARHAVTVIETLQEREAAQETNDEQ